MNYFAYVLQRAGAAQATQTPFGKKLEGPDLFLAVATKGHGIPKPV